MTTIKEAKAQFASEFQSILNQLKELCDKHGVIFHDSSGIDDSYVPNRIVLGDDNYWESSRC